MLKKIPSLGTFCTQTVKEVLKETGGWPEVSRRRRGDKRSHHVVECAAAESRDVRI